MMLICLIISFIAAGNHTTQAAFTPALLLYRLPRPQTHSSAARQTRSQALARIADRVQQTV